MSQFASPSPQLVPSYKWLRVLFSKVITTLQRSKMLHFSFCFYADVAFLSAAARRASDSSSASIAAHSVWRYQEAEAGKDVEEQQHRLHHQQ